MKKLIFTKKMNSHILHLNLKDIPDVCCVIRLKDTNNYLHIKEDVFFFAEIMHGCYVLMPEVAELILKKIGNLTHLGHNLEIVKFIDAYNQHGIIEKQIRYN